MLILEFDDKLVMEIMTKKYKGDTLIDLEQYEEARLEYEKALKVYPESLRAMVGKGRSYYFQEKFKEAIECYDQAISQEPRYLSAYLWKAYALFASGSYDECLAVSEKMTQINPREGFGYYLKSKVYAQQQKETEAYDNLKKAVELNKIFIEYAKYDPTFDPYRGSSSFLEIIADKTN